MPMTLRLIPELEQRAAVQVQRTGISMTKLIAIALDNYLTFQERQQPRNALVSRPVNPPASRPPSPTSAASPAINAPRPMKQGRNHPCACGSGAKFKNCCINKVSA